MEHIQADNSKEGIISLLSAIVLSVGICLWLSPHIFVSFWGWFVIPLGVPAIGHWHALGLMTMVHLVTFQMTYNLVRNTNQTVGGLSHFGKAIAIVIGLLMVWIIGYLCS